MKIFASILLVSFLSATVAIGQQVPEAVVTTFNQMFPDVEDVVWEYDDEQWEAEFTTAGNQMEAAFAADGNWTETEIEMPLDQVPASVTSAFAKYPGYEMIEASAIRTPEIERAFEVRIKKGNDVVEMLIDASGKVLKMSNDDDDEDDQ